MKPQKKSSRPTLKDIARKANLSLSTISLVLRDPETTRVSSATRKRVVEIVKRFNYRPNLLAGSLVGFDDIEMAGLPGVELTTISHPKHTLGRLAVEQLLAKIKDQSDNVVKKSFIDPVLVIRKTCGYQT